MKKYLKYGIVTAMIVLGVLVGFLLISFSKEEKNIYKEDDLVFNQVESYQNISYDSDVQLIQSPCDCIWGDYAGFRLPQDVILKSDYGMMVGEEEAIHDYVFEFVGKENRQVTIAYSSISKPIRDYFILSDAEVSNMNGTEVILYQYQNMFIASFYSNQKYYDIETIDLTKKEFITLIKGIIKDDINGMKLNINTLSNLKFVSLDANVHVISAWDSTVEVNLPWDFEDLGISFDNVYLVYLDNKLHDLQYVYKKNDKEIVVTHSNYGEPIRDYYFLSDEAVSYAYGCELIINEYQNQYFISFQIDNLYYEVETTNISEDELLKVLRKIIWNCR